MSMGNVRKLLGGDAYAFETITVAGTSIGFTTGTWKVGSYSSLRAFCTITGGMIRYRYDGSDPTTTVGHIKSNGDEFAVEGTVNIEKFKAIRVGSESGILTVTYEKVEN